MFEIINSANSVCFGSDDAGMLYYAAKRIYGEGETSNMETAHFGFAPKRTKRRFSSKLPTRPVYRDKPQIAFSGR